jgi:hypothetical protein
MHLLVKCLMNVHKKQKHGIIMLPLVHLMPSQQIQLLAQHLPKMSLKVEQVFHKPMSTSTNP